MRRWDRLGWGFVVACGVSACGGGGGTEVNSGLPDDSTLVGLTAAEQDQLCDAVLAAYDRTVAEIDPCLANGHSAANGTYLTAADRTTVSDAELQSACQTAYSNCQGNPAPPAQSQAQCTIAGSLPASCTVTVGETERCFSDFLSATRQRYLELPGCAELTVAGVQANLNSGAISLPESCQPLQNCSNPPP